MNPARAIRNWAALLAAGSLLGLNAFAQPQADCMPAARALVAQ